MIKEDLYIPFLKIIYEVKLNFWSVRLNYKQIKRLNGITTKNWNN